MPKSCGRRPRDSLNRDCHSYAHLATLLDLSEEASIMKLQKLRVSGFRSLRDVAWEPGNLNVIIGPNGSGKSNLLRALTMLQESARGTLSASVLRQGGIAPLLWDGAA